ncbi:MAG: hypothetical protein K2X48_00370 [Chitinophagaceae bacterium]|nr:hypothetical protein [Chitinophagaceae bacterium]
MSTTIAAYYSDELTGWNEAILFYNEEVDELEQKLEEVIRRNSIQGIAEKVETHQALLNHTSEKFYRIQLQIQQQEAALKADSTLLDDTAIKNETGQKQNDLRREMQAAEKEYIDAKFECYNFLSGILKK